VKYFKLHGAAASTITLVMNMQRTYDAVIVGAGFAGLSAALWLGRFRRSVLVVSSGTSRNAKSHRLHGYPGFDGVDPATLLSKMHEEAMTYGAKFEEAHIDHIGRSGASFVAQSAGGTTYLSRRILIATGKTDVTPDIPSFTDFEGVSAWHCPACDGYEYSGRKIVVIGWGKHIAGYAREFLAYTSDILLLTNGHADQVSSDARKSLQDSGIPVIDVPVSRLVPVSGGKKRIKSLALEDGTNIPADAMFYSIGQEPKLELLRELGCDIEGGAALVNHQQETCVPGVYAAGDIAPLEELVVVACATGAVAANNIHASLQKY
jgi:thioredoxin reductase